MPAVTLTARLEENGARILNGQLDAFKHDVRARQRYARILGGYVLRDAKRNLREQRNLDGTAFAPRKERRRKMKLLRGLARRLKVISQAGNGGGVKITWSNGFEAGIAGRHQYGIGEEWSPRRAEKEYGKPDYDAPCTLKQARALIREGYKRPRKGKPPKRVSVKELLETLTLGQAGQILRIMQTGKVKGKQSWRDTVPKRVFLGASPQKAEEYSNRLAENILKNARKGKA